MSSRMESYISQGLC